MTTDCIQASSLDCHSERGAAASTIILMTPIMLVLLWFVVFAGRMVTTQHDVTSAARDGARAAAVSGTADYGRLVALSAVEQTLRGAGVACANPQIDVNLSEFGAGGQVTVAVRCEVSIADVTSTWAPGTKTFEASSTAVVDTYRGGDE